MLRLSVIVGFVLVCANAIQVRVKTHIVSEDTLPVVGSELTLMCEVDGYPAPDVSWYKDYAQIFSDDRITIAENRLTVSRVNRNDSGLYRCYAVNDLSSHQSSALIIVVDPRWLSTTEDGGTSITNKEGSTTETTESTERDLSSTTEYFRTTDRLDTSSTEDPRWLSTTEDGGTGITNKEGSTTETTESTERDLSSTTEYFRTTDRLDTSSTEDPRWLSTTEDGGTSITNKEGSTTETTESTERDLSSTTEYFRTTDRLDTSSTEDPRWLSTTEDGGTGITNKEGSTTETTESTERDLSSTTEYFRTTDRLDTSSTEDSRWLSTTEDVGTSITNKEGSTTETTESTERDLSSTTEYFRTTDRLDTSSTEDPRWLSTTEDGGTSITNKEGSTTETTESTERDLSSTTEYFRTTDRLDTSSTEDPRWLSTTEDSGTSITNKEGSTTETTESTERDLSSTTEYFRTTDRLDTSSTEDPRWLSTTEDVGTSITNKEGSTTETTESTERDLSSTTEYFRTTDRLDTSSTEDPRWLSTTEDGGTSITNKEGSTTETTESTERDLSSTTEYFRTTDRLDTSSTEVRVKTHIVSKDTWLAAGSDLTLVCEMDGYPFPAVSWYKDFTEISSDDRITIAEYRLTVSRVNKNDSGLYRCYAVNDLNSPHSSVLIIVKESDESGTTRSTKTSEIREILMSPVPVETHKVGIQLNLVCAVDDYPVPAVSWYKDHAEISSDDRITMAETRLTVSRLNNNDTGLYECYAVNDFNSHYSSVQIIVADPRWLSTTEDGGTGITNKEGSTTETTESTERDLSSTTEYFRTTDRLDTSSTEDPRWLSTTEDVGTSITNKEGSTTETTESTERDLSSTTEYFRTTDRLDTSSTEDPRWLSTTEDGGTSITNKEGSTTETTESTERDLSSTTEYFRTTDRLDTSSTEVRVKTHIVSKDTWLAAGSDLTLVCEMDGYPFPAVSWYKDFTEISSDDRITIAEYRLTVSRVNKNDSGLYRCYAVNDLNSPHSSVLIIVKESDESGTTRSTKTSEIREILMSPVPVETHKVGIQLNLVCAVDDYPVPAVSWYKDHAEISSDDRITMAETRLTVSRLNNNDTGLYECYAVNDFNSHYSSVQIIVAGLYIPPTCKDNPYFKCNLIVRSKVCSHKFYSKFCCKSCVEAGQLDVRDLQLQYDDTLYRK